MINPNYEKRPDINQVIENPWLNIDEFKNKELLNNLENKLKKEFQKREIDYKQSCKENKITSNNNNKNKKERKGSNDEDIEDIFKDLNPEYLGDFKFDYNKNYVKINGVIEPCQFMNSLIQQIKNNFKDEDVSFPIDEKKEELDFHCIFEYDENEEKEKIKCKLKEIGIEEISDFYYYFIKKNLEFEIKLFKVDNKTHIIRFMKISGNIEDYYKKRDKIILLIRDFL